MAQRNRSSDVRTIPIDWGNARAERIAYEPGAAIFRQGDAATTLFFIEAGVVRLSVVSPTGKEAVIAVLENDELFGEGCLSGHPVRTATATAMSACLVTRLRREEVARKLHAERSFSDFFLARILERNLRLEESLIDQLFNSTERRLARTLWLLAQDPRGAGPRRALPKVSQELLAEMVGTTRPRVNFFMNKFRRLGLITYDARGLHVNHTLLGTVLADGHGDPTRVPNGTAGDDGSSDHD